MRKILSGIGLMLHVPAFMAIFSLIISITFNEGFGTEAFLLTGIGSLVLAQTLYRQYPSKDITYSLKDKMMIALLGWIGASLLAAVPYYYVAITLPEGMVETFKMTPFTEFINALFEATSGYTSTGLTVTIAESELPHSIQWWRSFQQWAGGIGIIVFVSTYHSGISSVSSSYSADKASPNILPQVGISWSKIWWIYLVFTACCIGLLLLHKLPLWEAINHGMTGISTGGFTITDNSLQNYPDLLNGTVMFIMILGSLNFNLYHLLLVKGKWKSFITDQQHVLFFSLILAGTVYLFYENNIFADTGTTWIDLLFQTISALGTCGFQSTKIGTLYWSTPALLLLSVFMLIGGTTASTTGGIKLLRFILLLKENFSGALLWILNYEKKKTVEYPVKNSVNEETLKLYRNINNFLFFWVLFYLLSFFILLHNVPEKYSLSEVFFESASAMGTTGLSVGITSHQLNAIAKTDLMLTMLVGRLELIPLAIFFLSIFKHKKKD